MQLENIKTIKDAEAYMKGKKRLRVVESEEILRNVKHNSNFLEKYKNKLSWNAISKYGCVSTTFVTKYINKLSFSRLAENQQCPLNVYTKFAKYCNELIVKCKVYYKDIARVVHNGGKIRCNKITVLD